MVLPIIKTTLDGDSPGRAIINQDLRCLEFESETNRFAFVQTQLCRRVN